MRNEKINIKLHDVPGSIFTDSRTGRLIVQVKNKRRYTGMLDTPLNRLTAQKIKENLYLEAIGLRQPVEIRRKRIQELFKIYMSEREINRAINTIKSDSLSFKTIITRNMYALPDLIEEEVKKFLTNSKVSNATKNIYMRTFQTFLNWLHEHGHIEKRLNLKKKYFLKGTGKENEIYTDEELKLLFAYFAKTDNEFYILIKFMLLTGFRIGEALSLKWSQIKKNKIILSNKINQEPEIAVISPAIHSLLNELKTANREKVFRWKETTYSRLNRRLSDAMQELGIEKRERSFHEFRKTFLYKMQRNGVPVEIAQKMMRHKDIKVTIRNYQLIKEKSLEEVALGISESIENLEK